MESRVSNLEAKFDEFKKSHDLILLQLQSLMAKCHDSISNSRQPFIKMASHISILKSNEIVLKLQSFHNEKIQAREKVDEFLSQYRPKYKPKSPPCLRPTLKKFKRVRDYAKYHEDGSAMFRSSSKFQESFGFFRSDLAGNNGKVFDLLDKKVEDSVIISPVFDSDCMKSKIQACVLGSSVPNGLVAAFRGKFDQFRTWPLSNRESNCKNDLAQEFIFIISVSDDGFVKNDSFALQVFDERSHSTNDCDLQLGYHMPISDTGGTLIRGFFTSNVQIKDAHSSKFLVCTGEVMKHGTIVHLKRGFHELILDKGGTTIQMLLNSKSTGRVGTILVQENAAAQLFGVLQPFGGFYNYAIVSVSFQFTYHKGIRDKGGPIFLSEFNSMDFQAICELGFVLNAKKMNFLEAADPLIVPVETTFLVFNLFAKMWLSSCCMCYWKGIHDKDRGLKFRDEKLQAYAANRGGLVEGSFQLDYPSVEATEALRMVAPMTDGITVMSTVAGKSEVADLARVHTDYVAGIIWLILISIGKTNKIVGNTVLSKTWGLLDDKADSCQSIWLLELTHQFSNNTTSMYDNFVFTVVIGVLFAEKEENQFYKVGVQVDSPCRCSVHLISVIMNQYYRCGNTQNALQFLLDPDLCRLTKPLFLGLLVRRMCYDIGF